MNKTRERLIKISKQLKALQKKAEWPDPKDLKEGSFNKWCVDHGHKGGASLTCAKHAWRVANENNDETLRGKVSFYMNTVKPEGKNLSDIADDKKN